MESPYATARGNSEHPKANKKRLYTDILTIIRAAAGCPELHVQKLWPNIDWVRKWKFFNDVPVPDNTKCIRYQVIHDLIPTNVRLNRMNMIPSDACRRCIKTDTLEYRLIACCEGRRIRHYSETLIASMLRTIPARITDDWILHQQFNIWPHKRHRAILCVIDKTVIFRIQQQMNLT